mmetsp:Transcript_10115/g.19969  ORF Transcript_10115/g.19969 Transcript_10115/m.19969 type:complete len:208 (-) Transcript_10115:1261-1884(-)
MSGKAESPRSVGSSRKSKNKEKNGKESKKKTMYKPSRVTVEYYSNNADTMSPTQSCASPERRSVKDARQQSGFGSPRRSIPLSPKRPSTPLSARSPTSIRSQLSSLSRKFRKEALLSDDELRISATKSPKIEESDQKKKIRTSRSDCSHFTTCQKIHAGYLKRTYRKKSASYFSTYRKKCEQTSGASSFRIHKQYRKGQVRNGGIEF